MSLDMDRTLTLIFTNSLTTQNTITKIWAFLQLTKKGILTKFWGRDSKDKPAMLIRSFRGFWWEIQILGTLDTSNFLQGGFLSRLTKFGVDISNHFWETKILVLPNPLNYVWNSFWKLFLYVVRPKKILIISAAILNSSTIITLMRAICSFLAL